MFNTIKSKIVIISLLMFIILSILFCVFSFLFLKTNKAIIIEGCSYEVEVLAKNINEIIVKIEDNARDLALFGEVFYKNGKNKELLRKTTVKAFKNYEKSLGGGIWFIPDDKVFKKRLNCVYAFRNKSNDLVLDDSFESEKYNYIEQLWYKEILSDIKKSKGIAWSSPYFEESGSNTLMVTAGYGIFYNGNLVGLSTVDWEFDSIIKSLENIRPTQNTFILFADRIHDFIIVSNDPFLNNEKLIGKSLENIPWYNDNLKDITYINYHNKKYIPYVKTLYNGMLLVVNVPKNELFLLLYKHVMGLFIGLFVIGIVISSLLYAVLKRSIKKPIDKLTEIAKKIGNGNLDIKIKLEKPEEFANLAETFNKMISDIKNITKEREKIESELALAKAIQASSLPNVFPPFPDNNKFDIFAQMEPAKEVGGDFYDFYFIDEKNFMFVIADVSGKGVPAALFMMTVKTLINYIAQSGYPPQEMIKIINKKICSNNKQGFFVTLLAGIINVDTGELTFINCGHNPPLIKSDDEEFKYLNLNTNIVLGAFDNAEFVENKVNLNKGDVVILYTDGVTEAINTEGEMFGEEKLLNAANKYKNESIQNIQKSISNEVNKFSENCQKTDDMTILSLKYSGKNVNKEFYKNIASKENYKDFLEWLMQACKKFEIDSNIQMKLELICEEIYTNIFSYAYSSIDGDIEVFLEKNDNKIILEISDNGPEFNPLLKPDPDVDFPPQDREKGGLGIFIVRNSVDKISYKYENNKNILNMELLVK